MARRMIRAALAALLGALVAVAGFARLAHADPPPSQVQVTGVIAADGIADVKGRVTGGVGPVPGANVKVAVQGTEVGQVHASENGEFAVRIDLSDHPVGTHTITASFDGGGSFAPSSGTTTVTVPAKAGSVITADVEPNLALPGQLVTISGTLKTAAGAAVANATVRVTVGGTEARDSSTTTNTNGSYQTIYVVPEDYATTAVTITVSFAGNVGAGPATINTNVQVEPDAAAESSPIAPTPSIVASFAPSVPAIPAPTPSASAAPASSPSSTKPGFPWLIVGGLAIAVFGGAVTVGVLYRDRIARHQEAPADTLLDDFDGTAH